MNSHPSISLCMIVRDEEAWIEQAVQSVLPIVSEIIIVDTGSVDRTPEIAQKLGATVVVEPWEMDFSKHRNTSIEHASGDWILVLDADEVINESDHRRILELARDSSKCYLLTQRHYTNDQRMEGFHPCRGEYPEWEREFGGYFESHLSRLFPRDTRIEYRGVVHELVEYSIEDLPEYEIVSSGIRLHHYGQSPQIRKKKRKADLYQSLGRAKLADDPSGWKALYELAVEQLGTGELEDSIKAFQESIELKPDHLQSWTNLGWALTELGQLDKAIETLSQALEMNPLDPPSHCNLAVAFMRTGDFILAEAHLKRAIHLKPNYVNAYTNLGQLYAQMKCFDQADKLFRTALDLYPENPTAVANLAQVRYLQKNYSDASRLLQHAKSMPEAPVNVWTLLYQIERSMGQIKKAVEVLNDLRDRLLEGRFELNEREYSKTLQAVEHDLAKLIEYESKVRISQS